MTNRSVIDQFHHLLGSELLIRAAVSRSELKSGYEYCTIEIVSTCPDLYDGLITHRASGFVHLVWYCGYEEGKSDMHSSPLNFYSLVIEKDVTGEDSLRRARPHLTQVLGQWEGGVTGDGPRPYTQWLEPKPFVAVASLGSRPNARIELLPQNSRPLLAYCGCLLGKLDAYLGELKHLYNEYDPGLEERYLLVEHMTYRWRSFVHQTQLKHFDALFAA